MTQVLARDMQSGAGAHVGIEVGRYAVAVCGVFDHATASFRMSFGDGLDSVSPTGIEQATFSDPGMLILELPACTVWLEVINERSDTKLSGVIASVDK